MVFQWETNEYVLFYFELCDCVFVLRLYEKPRMARVKINTVVNKF